jgi:hypothetical protein
MGRPFIFDLGDVSGGQNDSAAELIADNEMAELSNFFVDTASLRRRPGKDLVATYSEEILTVARYRSSVDAVETILLGCAASIARVNGATITAIEVSDGRVYPSLTTRWWAEQYGDEMFWCRRGNGGIKRLYGTASMEAGIAAPTVAPIVADGGAGKKSAGAYQLAYRYYNSVTGARSNWSPASKPITILDDHQLQATQIGVSSSQQVNARQIGATYPDAAIIYLVGQIDDNVTTTFYENALAPDEYGEADVDVNGNPQTDTRHGPPPDQAWALAVHKERLFVLNKDGLFFSEPGWMQSFKASSFIPVQNGTGLISWERHGLVILCEGETKILEGDTPGDFRLETLSREHGCPSGKASAIADGVLFWYTGQNIVASSGNTPQILPKNPYIRGTLDLIPEASKSDVVAETIPGRQWFVLSIPTASSRKLVVFDYMRSAFQTFPAGPKTIARFMRTTKAETLYAAFAGDTTLYEYMTGTDDYGTPISAALLTKNYGDDSRGMLKLTRRVNVLCPQTAGTCEIKVYHDGAVVATRSGLSLNAAGWKRFNVNTSSQPGTHVQVRLTYDSLPELRIDQMQVEGVLLVGRRPRPA